MSIRRPALLPVVPDEFRAQPARLHAHDRVVSRIEGVLLAEHLHADDVFLQLMSAAGHGLHHDERQEALQAIALLKRLARQNAFKVLSDGLVGWRCQIAEGFICTSGKNPQLYTNLTGKVDEGLARAGRSGADLERMIEVKVSFDTDPQQAKELTRHWAALALTPEEKVSVEDPIEMERLADALPLDRAASRWIVSADPEEQLAQIRPYVELGFTHLVFHAPGPDQARFLKLYAERVLPLLRSKLG